jgi:hypothetical protein
MESIIPGKEMIVLWEIALVGVLPAGSGGGKGVDGRLSHLRR